MGENSENENGEVKNVVKKSYDEVKGPLKAVFNYFMDAPEEFGVENKEEQNTIKNTKGLEKHYAWKNFKAITANQMEMLSHEEASSVFVEDFAADDDLKNLTKSQLKKIIADPENPDFALEPQTINYIKHSENFDQDEFINDVLNLVDENKDDRSGIAGEMVNLLENVWDHAAPTLGMIFNKLVNISAEAVKTLATASTPAYLDGLVIGGVNITAEAIKKYGGKVFEQDDIVDTVVDAGEAAVDFVSSKIEDFQNRELEIAAEGVEIELSGEGDNPIEG